MTTYTQARDAIVGHINTALNTDQPTLKVFYENTLSVDMDAVGDMFLRVEIDFQDSVQSDLDIDPYDQAVLPGDRTSGEVVLQLFVREGVGIRSSLVFFDYVRSLMKMRNLSGVQTGVPTPGRKTVRDGWVSQEIIVPISFYSKF
jgi:hypothetical protein